MPLDHSKRRYLRFFIPLILAIIFFGLVPHTARRASWYEEVFWNIMAPPQYLMSLISNGIGGVWKGYVALVGVDEENQVLKAKVASLEGDIMKFEETEKENERLRGLLAFSDKIKGEKLVARVVANDPRSEFKSITIDKGSADGIEPLMPVVGPRGLVGKVGRVMHGYSRVLLITDPNSAVDVFDERSRSRGLLVGTATHTQFKHSYFLTRFEYLKRGIDIATDDVVVTSGFDEVYPPGIPVGTVAEVKDVSLGVFTDVEVVPFEDTAQLEEVIVLLIRNDTPKFPNERN